MNQRVSEKVSFVFNALMINEFVPTYGACGGFMSIEFLGCLVM